MDRSEFEAKACNWRQRGKKRASEARLVLVLFFIGYGANFVDQSQSAVK